MKDTENEFSGFSGQVKYLLSTAPPSNFQTLAGLAAWPFSAWHKARLANVVAGVPLAELLYVAVGRKAAGQLGQNSRAQKSLSERRTVASTRTSQHTKSTHDS